MWIITGGLQPHKLWIIAGGPQITIDFIKLYLYLTTRESLLMTYYLKYLLVVELRFDAILYSKLGNKNYAGLYQPVRRAAFGPRVAGSQPLF